MDRQALITELHEMAAMHEKSRFEAQLKGEPTQAAYFMGRRDQCYSAAGLIAGPMTDDERDVAIQQLDGYKFAGDTFVRMAGR